MQSRNRFQCLSFGTEQSSPMKVHAECKRQKLLVSIMDAKSFRTFFALSVGLTNDNVRYDRLEAL
jgi:hypothetical protein